MSNIITDKIKKKVHNALDTDSFIARAIKKHGDLYVYEKTKYINSLEKITIICRKHGEFYQSPANHLSGNGCPSCCGKRKTTDQVIKELIDKRGDRYDYSLVVYNKNEKLSIICRKHGIFKQKYWNHMKGHNCPVCNNESRNNKNRFKIEDLIHVFNEIHDSKYDYSRSVYVNIDTPIEIVCPIHGSFNQTPYHHKKQKSGCPKCTKSTPFSRSRYVKSCENNNGMSSLYLIRMFNDNESFYKVGITKHSINRRFNKNPYNIEVLEIVNAEAGYVYDLETLAHRLLRKYQYTPLICFGGGETECFSEIPKDVLNLISNINKTNQLQLIA